MKRLPILLFMLFPYFYLLLCMYSSHMDANIFYCFLGMVAVIYLPAAIYAFFLPRLGFSPRQILFWNMLLRLVFIPVYLVVFLLGVLILMTIVGVMLLPFLFLFDMLLLLTTACYGLSGILAAMKSDEISKTAAVTCGICQFFWIADVFCGIYLYVKSRRKSQIHP